MRIKIWMAQNKQGEFLCGGNLNHDLSYHLSFPFTCEHLCRQDWLMCRTKWEIEEHIRKWHRETRLYKQARCRAVRMVVSWVPYKPYEEEGAE
jgi:hypothetical protein